MSGPTDGQPSDHLSFSDQRIAVCHGHLLGRGGAEVRAEALCRVLDAPLFAGFGSTEYVSDDVDVHLVFEDSPLASALRGSKIVRDITEVLNWPGVAELREFDVLVFSGEGATWFPPAVDQAVVRVQGGLDHAAYGRADEFTGLKSRVMGAFRRLTLPTTTPFADVWITPSSWTAAECRRYLGESPEVICPPPIEVEPFVDDVRPHHERDDYLLTMSRLVGQKHVDEVIEACAATDHRLVVAGDGPDRERLEAMAGDDVEFVGWVDGEEKHDLLRSAEAFVFAGAHEAFGMVTAEAMAAGTPVLAVESGHTQRQIPRECGHLAPRGALVEALERFDRNGVEADAETIHHHAKQSFGTERFERQVRKAVRLAVNRTNVDRETLVRQTGRESTART
ncbi:glycosyltransferase [Halomarina oriensis]|uniref:Glycosyltransferase n=1 Tax=Halomarina oriensis TaxID=671145 RepID=A0A6B0GT72_9EURY|nr:glycosyltransferase [Halomarina oriensis]MWG35883.1 glycosyltransferase [Halomarina oriensis]